jgi:hypothetical protein
MDSMIFCQKNILEHSLSFYGDYKKKSLLTIRVSQILVLIQLISEKSIYRQKDFSLHSVINSIYSGRKLFSYTKVEGSNPGFRS